MKKNLFLITLMIYSFCFSQSEINFSEIKKAVTDNTSSYFYEKLVNKFDFDPLSLDSTEVKYLYYGKFYSKKKIKNFDLRTVEYSQLFHKGDYKKAIELGEKILKEDPTNLEILTLLMRCYEMVDKENKLYSIRIIQFGKLVDEIKNQAEETKDGKLYTVMSISDEYVISAVENYDLRNMKRSSKSNKNGIIDYWEGNGAQVSFLVIYNREDLRR